MRKLILDEARPNSSRINLNEKWLKINRSIIKITIEQKSDRFRKSYQGDSIKRETWFIHFISNFFTRMIEIIFSNSILILKYDWASGVQLAMFNTTELGVTVCSISLITPIFRVILRFFYNRRLFMRMM